jgi:hypothetical protein
MPPCRTLFLLILACWFVTFTPLTGTAGPLDDLTQVHAEVSHRNSSSGEPWQTSNGDCRPIPPGETLTLANLDGPGEIRHIWFTVAAEDTYYPASMVFRVYYDGRKEPGVEAPLGDFFGVGHGLKKDYQSLPLEISSEGRAYNCFWRMPFSKNARLEMTNESDKPVGCLFYYIDWVSLPALSHDTAYFHAQYRQEKPCKAGQNYLLLETEGRGHYVGTVLSVHHAEASWFGEGDDFFFIDGQKEPELKGTGSEDYFCDAWGFRAFQQLNHGVTIWEGYEPGCRGTAYRWHIQDPIRFSKSIHAEIEHKGARLNPDGTMLSGFVERADDYSSVAFWYQEGLPKRFAPFPPLAERRRKAITIEAEGQLEQIQHSGGGLQAQEGPYSGGKQILFSPPSATATLTLPFELKEPMKAAVRVILSQSWDYGTYEIQLDDGKPADPADCYSRNVIAGHVVTLQVGEIAAGPHRIQLKCVGANSRSKLKGTETTGHYLGLDAIELWELP